jgi:hypothetical protein
MKRSLFVVLGVAVTVLVGCVVTSVCPYYTQRDLVSEPAIVGNWINQNNTNELWKFEPSGELAYRFTMIEAQKATVMEAHTFKLQGQLFLDIFSLEQDIHVIPAHYLLKVSQVVPALKMSELNHEWLADLVTKDATALRHHFVRTGDNPEDRRVVLTADTSELQKFINKYLKTEGAWKESFELRRESAPIKTAQTKGQL